ncbi:MAG: hypothetical protein KDB80_02625, partial [Planctomycetes bacterium]|nr:hypothetical protein [Planctomycetota bacterium]
MAIGNLRWLGWAAIAALGAGCSGVPAVPRADDPAVQSIAELLDGEFGARSTPMPRTAQQVGWWDGVDCVVVVTDEAEAIEFDEQTRQAVLDWVRGGGTLVTFGFSARLAYDLGVEPEPPSRVEVVRWGDDDRTALGLLQYGFTVEGEHPELSRELRAFPREPASFLIGGGERVALQLCEWRDHRPRNGEVLGVLCELRDREFAPRGGAVLVRWDVGDGSILGCGCVPEPWRDAPAIASNARQFVRNAVGTTSDGTVPLRVRASLAIRSEVGTEVAEYVLPRLSERDVPGALLVPHWGWQVATNFLRDDRRPIAPRQVFDEVLVPSFRAGATLVDLQLADSRDGYPFAWNAGDPIARPASFHGGDFWPGWTADQIALLAREAHYRGMWLQCWLNPPPVHAASATDRDFLDATKWWAREFADVRRRPGGTIDGVGVHRWFRDGFGASSSVLRTFQPAMHLYGTAPFTSPVAGFVGAIDADRGRPAGVPVAGVSAQWRGGSDPAEFPDAALDCRERRPSSDAWGAYADRGGGSYPDWLVTQLGDFARRRAFVGAAFWWRAHNPTTLGSSTAEYVQGISLDPLRAAVAGRLTATGKGGYRDLFRELLERVQAGFGAETSLPAETPFLQNNHLRLHGSGGPLWFDRTATACFREGDERTLVVAPQFMTTHVRGFRPSVASVRSAVVDFIGARPRGEGGYESVARIEGDARGGDAFPAVLAREEQPSWPARVEAEFQLTRGRYELDLAATARADRGIVEISVDGEVVGMRSFQVGDGTRHHALQIDLAQDGVHRLALDVVDGGAVAVSQCRLTRV